MSGDISTSADPAVPPASPRPRRRTAILIGAFIFICGMLAGAATTFITLDRMMSQRFKHPEKMVEKMVDDLSVKLDLTAEQKTQVTAIMQQNRDNMDKLFREEIRPKVDAEFNALKTNVAAVLTPEQAAKWNDDFEQMRRRFGPQRSRSDKH